MQKNNRDWGKLIFKIAVLIFIIFFISRWFAGGGFSEDATVLSHPDSDTVQITEPDDEAVSEAEEEKAEETVSAPDKKPEPDVPAAEEEETVRYEFRNRKLLDKHYDKHGIDMGFSSAEKYEAAASAVITNPDSLHKLEEEDGDDVYYLEATREFVILSTDGFIRTYYYADKDYFDRQ